jgi:CHASE2 domain-containing sensor protein
MYKKQMTMQRILCLAAVVVSAIVFVYALGIMTDLYDALYDTMRNPADVFQTDVPGSIVYYNM